MASGIRQQVQLGIVRGVGERNCSNHRFHNPAFSRQGLAASTSPPISNQTRIPRTIHFVFATILIVMSFGTTDYTLSQEPVPMRVYVGPYTRGASEGIYVMYLDPQTGELTEPILAGEAKNPSFLVHHPTRNLLYSVQEVSDFQGRPSGGVSAFHVDTKSGKLSLINSQGSGGGGACHVIVDRTGQNVLVANYGGGSVSVLPIREDGGLAAATAFVQHEGSSVNSRRQSAPHAHSINVDQANRIAFVADLGLDKVMLYRFDAARGTLTANDPPWASLAPGSGPRHFALHGNGRYAYVVNEMLSTITAFTYDVDRGTLQELQTVSTLPAGFTGNNTTAEIQVHPSGKFVYGSNRGHDSIAVFSVDQTTGRLTAVEHESTQGKTPRNFDIDPSGGLLLAANQDSDSIVAFRIDRQTGALTPTGSKVYVASPVCVRILPPGQ